MKVSWIIMRSDFAPLYLPSFLPIQIFVKYFPCPFPRPEGFKDEPNAPDSSPAIEETWAVGVSTHQNEVLHREVRNHREDHHGEGSIECRLPLPENLSMKKEEGKEDADAEVTLWNGAWKGSCCRGNQRPGYGPRGLGWFPMADKMSRDFVYVCSEKGAFKREDATGLY